MCIETTKNYAVKRNAKKVREEKFTIISAIHQATAHTHDYHDANHISHRGPDTFHPHDHHRYYNSNPFSNRYVFPPLSSRSRPWSLFWSYDPLS